LKDLPVEMGHRADWEKSESQIIERYSKEELKAIRRHGYSGLSVQQRAEATGLGRCMKTLSHCVAQRPHVRSR
jgi:hypothetical protein